MKQAKTLTRTIGGGLLAGPERRREALEAADDGTDTLSV